MSDQELARDQAVQGAANETEESQTLQLSDAEFESICGSMKNKFKILRWSAHTIKENITSAEKVNKFSVAKIDVIAEMIKERKPLFVYKKSWRKADKVNAVSYILGDKSTVQCKERKQNGDVPSLKYLSEKVLSGTKVKKAALNGGYARYIFPSRLAEWKQNFPISTNVNVDGSSLNIDWYSVPERNPATGELLCKCIGSHHLLTNLRTKTSITGIRNISSEAWKKVARSYETKLTPSMVEDLVDKQSNANAQTHFSEEVERKMRQNGDIHEAVFCKLIREWYDTEDSPAITAKERIEKWLNLREYLLKDVDFSMFPPPTQYIKRLSLISFEGFLTGIDTKIQLYGLCGGAYCVRTASSLPAETCVCGIQDLNFNNSVAVKAKDIPNIMSSLCEIMTYKCNPNRGFYMRTSRASVYPIAEGKTAPGTPNDNVTGEYLENQSIVPRDHCFDSQNRRRTRPHRKSGTVNRNLDAAPRGTQPMRKEFFKCDESKINPLKRAGFQVDDLIESM